MSEDPVLYRLEDGVARIALNDPATLNAASEGMGIALRDAIGRASREARAVIVTGEGRAFSAGANLSDVSGLLADPMRDMGRDLETLFNPILLMIRGMDAPVISAVRGPAVGVGCALALAADIILCSETASFLQGFGRVGLVPDGGSSWLLTRAIGRVRAMRMMLLGEKLDAARALEWGLVSRVVPDDELDAAAMGIARDLAAGPCSLGITKKIAWAAVDTPLEGTLQIERSGQRDAGRTADFVEGVTAFMERRKPVFSGR